MTASGRAARQKTVEPAVFWTSAFLIAAFVGLGLVAPQTTGQVFNEIQSAFSTYAGWIYMTGVNVFLIFSFWLMLGRHGRVRLGGSGAVPRFSTLTWLSMLFSAGMGIGLVFWSVAEPISHFKTPPLGAAPMSVEAAQQAMTLTFFHWGIHAWAIYGVIAVALAYFSYNRGLPLTVRSAFYPLLGDRIHGPIGHGIDVVAILATMFGLATSLGLGAQQINAGLERLFALGQSVEAQIVLITLITLIAIASVVSGLDRGIRRLSELNVVMAALLLVFVFVCGATTFLLDALLQNVGRYLQRLLSLSTWTQAYSRSTWQHDWTIFYWAWWIAWSPFVGMFIARISYGRTIREFMLGVLLVPTAITALWLTVFGSSALYEELHGAGGIIAAVEANTATALYTLLERLPLAEVTSLVAVIVIVNFFVTSSDSGSLVIDTIASGGHPNPPVAQKVFWAAMEGVVAIVLLLANGLSALQAGSVLTGLPFTFVLLAMAYSLAKALRHDFADRD